MLRTLRAYRAPGARATTPLEPAGPGHHRTPAPARPAHIVHVIAPTFAGTCTDLAIGTDGTIKVMPTRAPPGTDLTFVSLESITYRR